MPEFSKKDRRDGIGQSICYNTSFSRPTINKSYIKKPYNKHKNELKNRTISNLSKEEIPIFDKPTGIFANLEFATTKYNILNDYKKSKITSVYIDPGAMFVVSVKHLLIANFGDFVLTDFQVAEIVNKINKENLSDFRIAAEKVNDRLKLSNIQKGKLFPIPAIGYDENKSLMIEDFLDTIHD